MSKASGTIYRSGGKERVSYATIKAYKAGKPTKYETTDEAGEFTLDLQDKGTWTFVAFEKGSFASETPLRSSLEPAPGLCGISS